MSYNKWYPATNKPRKVITTIPEDYNNAHKDTIALYRKAYSKAHKNKIADYMRKYRKQKQKVKA